LSGKGDRTLVLVHEMGGSLESWDEVVPRFMDSRRVLRYDTRGAGLSQKARRALGLDTMADDIAALLDCIGSTGKVALAGIAVRLPASRRIAAPRRWNASQRSRPSA
jgi:3-oxoadipate enol-lactonase